MAHPHRKEARNSAARKAGQLSDGKMTAGAASGPGRLQKIALQKQHPVLAGGGQPSTRSDVMPTNLGDEEVL